MQAHTAKTRDVQDRRTYQVEEIAGILGIGRSSAYELVKQGLFRTVKKRNPLMIGLTVKAINPEGDFSYGFDYQAQV